MDGCGRRLGKDGGLRTVKIKMIIKPVLEELHTDRVFQN
jgi:hypothetical protein